MKSLVANHPLSGLDLSIPYNAALDGRQTSAATMFLLNVPQHVILARLRAFMDRDGAGAHFFDLEHPDARAKGCWVVRRVNDDATPGAPAQQQQQHNFQFKVYHDGRHYCYTLGRLAVRLWHDETSVLRLLLSKDHETVRVCHNVWCFRPEHIVVESRKEYADRRACKREGRCKGHSIWSKCGREDERASCIFS